MPKTAKDIMHEHTFVPPQTPICEVARVMSDKNIGSVLIKGKNGIGILTERDIAKKLVKEAKDPRMVTAEDLMTYPLITVSEDTNPYQICQLFNNNSFRRLPVVNKKGDVIGLLTTRDVVRHIVPDLIKQVAGAKDSDSK